MSSTRRSGTDFTEISLSFEHHGISIGTVFDTKGTSHEVHGTRPLFYMLRRGSAPGTLDRALLDQAEVEGVEFRFADKVSRAVGRSVIATGPRRADVIAAGYLFDTDLPEGAWLALGDRLAPKGYAYLLVHGGRGTLATCMFTGFKGQAAHMEATRRFFEGRLEFEMQNLRPFGGYGTVRLPRTALQGGHPVIGERAGFQDALAGFGIRYAMRSGLLAAQSILENTDYDRLWQRELGPALTRGLLNRFFMNHVPHGILDRGAANLAKGDAGATLKQLYRPGALSRIALPILQRFQPRSLSGRACRKFRCVCIWCKCAARSAAQGAV
ncbi:MAG: NAD(P)/FAD-dependent oxidoreductase [Halocynthiibacter sp.]